MWKYLVSSRSVPSPTDSTCPPQRSEGVTYVVFERGVRVSDPLHITVYHSLVSLHELRILTTYYYVTQVRSDELGLPFIVTIDFEAIDKTKCKSENRFDTATVRERDSAKQIRVKCDEVANLIFDLVMGRVQWSECLSKYANEN